MRRRAFLSGCATALGTAAGAVVSTRSASATDADWRSENVEQKDITYTFDEAFLKRHRPVFVASRAVTQKYIGLFGYRCDSPEYEYTYAYYWSQLVKQDGLPLVSKDAHFGDHEPIIVAVDPQTGDPERVVWTNYHHFAGRADADDLYFVADETSEPTHPVFEVDERWHNYYATRSDEWARSPFPLRDWLSARDDWIRNGFYDETDAGAIEDPEVMDTAPIGEQREKWWADGTLDAWFAKGWAKARLGGINRADHLDF